MYRNYLLNHQTMRNIYQKVKQNIFRNRITAVKIDKIFIFKFHDNSKFKPNHIVLINRAEKDKCQFLCELNDTRASLDHISNEKVG